MYAKFFLVVLCCLCCVDAKICTSMDIRTNTKSNITTRFQFGQLRHCTKIVGFLKLVLLHDVDDFPTFPALKEVTGYVLVFRARNLYNLGDIFPNLMVIRGNLLLEGNALIIHHNNEVEKIGLSNLREIQRGKVQIGKCPNLCFVHTVNWTDLGTSLSKYSEIPQCENEECAPDCKGQCWTPGRCQKPKDNHCHAECLGCSKPNSAKDCELCRNLKDGDTCVSQCPPGKFVSEEMLTCVTKKECETMNLPGKRWVFDKLCLLENTCPEKYGLFNTSTGFTCGPCLGNCTKICSGTSVENKEDIEFLKGCTHINGHLEFKIRDVYVIDQLAENLGDIREIDGCLKVARSDAITSLQFFKRLKRISGRDKHKQCNNYTVFIYENANLRSLVDVEKLETSSDVGIGFHNNPELCLTKIKKFALTLGVKETEFDAIIKEGKHISPYSNGDKAPCADLTLNITILENNPTNITLKWDPYKMNETNVIGYTVFYILSSVSIDERSSDMCNANSWFSRFVSNNSIQLIQLTPFSVYEYWIKVYYQIKADIMSGVAGSTKKHKFMTAPDDPTQPLGFQLIPNSPTSINITWEPPEYSNGNLSHYQLIAFVEKDDPQFVTRRNYCVYPHIINEVRELIKPPMTKWYNQTENGTCICETKIFKINDTFCGPSSSGLAFSNDDCNKYMYQIMSTKRKARRKRYLLEAKTGARRQPNSTVIEIRLPANETTYVLKNLKPFTTYIVLFSACNQDFRGKPQCSAVLLDANRTMANFTADKITNLNVQIVKDNEVFVKWLDPPEPNGMIVAYNIEYKIIDSSKSIVPDCITWTEHDQNHFVYRIVDMDPGIYTMRVRPISLYAPGSYSNPVTFEIKSPLKTWVIYLLVCIVFFILIILLLIYMWLKKEEEPDHMRLITTINPDYVPSDFLENFDNMSSEFDKDDIEIHELFGQGSFGLVYKGYIKSRNIYCAIKTLHTDASSECKMLFLNEAAVMRNFCNASHVVKLYGVVTRGDFPLVVMELMERGDLKEYLLKCKACSQTMSTPEIYLMAAQIADGMTYLAAKKYVHRDLAARNCMVAADRTVKIGDFGMTRDIYENDYYKKGGPKSLLPVRWMAPESLADGVFSAESDVWSYGVTLWEIITVGDTPFEHMSNEHTFQYIINGGSLDRPAECPDLLWEIMESCWAQRARKRPLFVGIVEKLTPFVGPSFSLVSFYHSKDGQHHRLNYRKANLRFVRPSTTPAYCPAYADEDELMLEDQTVLKSNNRLLRRKIGGSDGVSWQSLASVSDDEIDS